MRPLDPSFEAYAFAPAPQETVEDRRTGVVPLLWGAPRHLSHPGTETTGRTTGPLTFP